MTPSSNIPAKAKLRYSQDVADFQRFNNLQNFDASFLKSVVEEKEVTTAEFEKTTKRTIAH